MAEVHNGGPAFPTRVVKRMEGWSDEERPHPYFIEGESGMTLRDYFAAKAPAIPKSVLDVDPWIGEFGGEHRGHLQCLTPIEQQAWFAYRHADAMLKAREWQEP